MISPSLETRTFLIDTFRPAAIRHMNMNGRYVHLVNRRFNAEILLHSVPMMGLDGIEKDFTIPREKKHIPYP